MQCSSFTLSGSQCKRLCHHGATKCFQHGKTSSTSATPAPRRPRKIDIIDLTIDEEPRRGMQTRLSKRKQLERELGIVMEVIETSRDQRDERNLYREQRVKPRPPRRPRNHSHQKEDDCCICYDTRVREERFLECGHAMCEGCIKQLRNDQCPMCRKEINSKFISKAEKKRMQRRKRDDDEERNEEQYQAYMLELIRETGGNRRLLRELGFA